VFLCVKFVKGAAGKVCVLIWFLRVQVRHTCTHTRITCIFGHIHQSHTHSHIYTHKHTHTSRLVVAGGGGGAGYCVNGGAGGGSSGQAGFDCVSNAYVGGGGGNQTAGGAGHYIASVDGTFKSTSGTLGQGGDGNRGSGGGGGGYYGGGGGMCLCVCMCVYVVCEFYLGTCVRLLWMYMCVYVYV